MAENRIPDEEMAGLFESTEELEAEEKDKRQTPMSDSEKRRRGRQVGVTFSSEEIPDRLRDLALAWGLRTLRGGPAVSELVEYLIMPRLEQAERGEIGPPEGAG